MKSRTATFSLCATILLSSGCGWLTVTPPQVESHSASFDGNERNSGILGTNQAGLWILTPHAYDRAVTLVKLQPKLRAYNGNFQLATPLRRQFWTGNIDGLAPYTNGTWTADNQTMTDLLLLNQWRKQAGL